MAQERVERRLAAILIVPGYGQARSLLAWALLRPPFGGSDLGTFLPEAFAESVAALGVDERDAWAHLTHGIALWRMRRHRDAEQEFRRALEFNPNFALALAFLGSPLTARGADQEAIKCAERALRLSPADGLVSAYACFAMMFAHFVTARYSDCVVWARKLIEKQPENLMANYMLIAATAMTGDELVAAEKLVVLLGLRPHFSRAWVRENSPLAGEMLERVLEGLRRAGVPEE